MMLSKLKTPAISAVLIVMFVGLVALCYLPILRDPDDVRQLGPGDAHTEGGPNAFFYDSCVRNGEIPLWNPISFCGMPYAANPIRFVFYPPYLMRALLTFPGTPAASHDTLRLFVFAHMALAGFGAFLWARRQQLSMAAALTAAIGYMLSSSMVYRALAHYGFTIVAGWFPFLLIAAERVMTEETLRGKVREGAMGALVLGMVVLSGAHQMLILAGCAFAVYWAAARVSFMHLPQTPGRGVVRRWLSGVSGDAVAAAIMLGGALLMALVVLVPAFELAGFSERTRGAGAMLYIRGNEIPNWNVLQTLLVYGGSKSNEGLKAAGAIIALLALGAITHPRRRAVGLHVLLFLVLLDCSLGRPYPCSTLLSTLSPYEMSNAPRAMVLACFPLAMLAGWGVDAITRAGRGRVIRVIQTVLLAAGGGYFLYLLAISILPHPFAELSPLTFWLPVATLAAALTAVWFAGRPVWGLVFPVFVAIEVVVWNWSLVPFYLAEQNQYPGTMAALRQPAAFWSDNERGGEAVPEHQLYMLSPAANGYDPLHLGYVRRAICHPMWDLRYKRHVTEEEAFASHFRGNLLLKRQFWLARQYVDAPLPAKLRPFPSTTTVYAEGVENLSVPRIAADDVPARCVSEQAKRLDLLADAELPLVIPAQENQNGDLTATITIPEIRIPALHTSMTLQVITPARCRVTPRFRDLDTGATRLGTALYLPRCDAPGMLYEFPLPDLTHFEAAIDFEYISRTDQPIEVGGLYLEYDEADEQALIHISQRTANTVELCVGPLADNRILVFVDAWYPGWRAYVDGVRVPVFRADDAFKAIALSPGMHVVRFKFAPISTYCALVASALAVLTLLGLLLPSRKMRRISLAPFIATLVMAGAAILSGRSEAGGAERLPAQYAGDTAANETAFWHPAPAPPVKEQWDFRQPEAMADWSFFKQGAEATPEGVRIAQKRAEVLRADRLLLNAPEYKRVRVVLGVPEHAADGSPVPVPKVLLYWAREEEYRQNRDWPFNGARGLTLYPKEGGFEIDLGRHPDWSGKVASVFLDVSWPDGIQAERPVVVQSIAFLKE